MAIRWSRPLIQSDSALETAVARGIISKSQANSIRLIASEEAGESKLPPSNQENDDEGFRFITGFSDIFLAIGVIVLLSGVLKTGLLDSVPGAFLVAAICWVLSEIVASWQRRSLPSMVSAAGFVFFISLAIFSFLQDTEPKRLISDYGELLLQAGTSAWKMPLLIFGSSVVYYARFRLPFSLFLGAVSFAATVLTALFYSLEGSQIADFIIPVLFVTGVVVFCAALYFDTRDPDRHSRLSDNAFWLHLVASPLMVHSIMWQSAIWISGSETFSFQSLEAAAFPLSLVVLAIFIVLMVAALIVNRRAMLVSSLIYVTLSLTYLGSEYGGFSSVAAFVPIIIGGGMLSIGIGWQPLRKLLFAILPLNSLSPYLCPVK